MIISPMVLRLVRDLAEVKAHIDAEELAKGESDFNKRALKRRLSERYYNEYIGPWKDANETS